MLVSVSLLLVYKVVTVKLVQHTGKACIQRRRMGHKGVRYKKAALSHLIVDPLDLPDEGFLRQFILGIGLKLHREVLDDTLDR